MASSSPIRLRGPTRPRWRNPGSPSATTASPSPLRIKSRRRASSKSSSTSAIGRSRVPTSFRCRRGRPSPNLSCGWTACRSKERFWRPTRPAKSTRRSSASGATPRSWNTSGATRCKLAFFPFHPAARARSSWNIARCCRSRTVWCATSTRSTRKSSPPARWRMSASTSRSAPRTRCTPSTRPPTRTGSTSNGTATTGPPSATRRATCCPTRTLS